MNTEADTSHSICPQCSIANDVDARFCKSCAFDLSQSQAYENSHIDDPSSVSKAKYPIIILIGLLLFVSVVGFMVAMGFRKSSTLSHSNANSAPPPSAVLLSEKAQQIEERILRGEALNSTDLEGLPQPELRILRNVHFARYGRKYERPGLGDYFYTRSWYKPSDDFNDALLTSTDKENVKLFVSTEQGTTLPTNDSSSIANEKFDNTPETQPAGIYTEAQTQAESFWNKKFTKCGVSYYLNVHKWEYGLREYVYECKGEASVFPEGEGFESRALTEAEKLNGVDPLPYEWKGHAVLQFSACRTKRLAFRGHPMNEPFDKWRDNVSIKMPLWKSKGRWNLPNIPLGLNGSETSQTSIGAFQCSDIPIN